MSKNPLIENPHIYKKGKILNFKKLNEKDNKDRKYVFSSSTGNLPSLVHQGNNINQIVGRNWLGIHKLLSYFGIAKDPSEKLSKNPSNFNKFWQLFREGGNDNKNDLKKILGLIEDQKNKLNNLEKKISELKPREIPIKRNEVLDFTSKLREIEKYLRELLGKDPLPE